VQSRLTQARAGRFSRQAGRRFDGLSALAEAAKLAHELDAPRERFLELRNEAIACMALTDVRPVRRLQDLSWGDVTTGFGQQVAFDSRWEMYARGDGEGNVSVRRLADEQEVARFSKPGSVATFLLFSPEGRYLAAKFYRNHSERPVEYVVWDWQQEKEILRTLCAGLSRPLPDFAFTPDGRQLIVGGRWDGSLGFFDLASVQEVRRLSLGREAPWSIALHPGGKRLAAILEGKVTIWDLDTNKVLASWKPATSVWGLAWHPDGNLLAAAGDRAISLWDAVTGQQRRVLEGHENQVVHVTFNHAGTLLASWGWDQTTRLWDAHSGRELVTVPSHAPLAFSPDDRSLAYLRGNELGIWEVAHERVYRTLYGNGKEVRGVQFSPSGRLVASAGDDGVRLWDADAGRVVAALPGGPTYNALFTPGGDSLLTSGDQGLYRWPLRSSVDAADDRLRLGPPQTLSVPMSQRLEGAVCDRRGHHLAVVDMWQKGIVVNLDDPAARPTLLIGHDHVAYIGLSPDGRWAATGAFKGTDVKIWDLSQGVRPQAIATIASGAAYPTFSPDGRWLVVPGDGGYRFYTVGSWELDSTMSKRKQGGPVFAADAAVMAAGTEDGKQMKLIASDTGRELVTLTPQESQTTIFPRGLSADGGRLAATTSSHAIQLWDLRAVRRQLDEMHLDWEMPPYPEEADAALGPLAVQVVGADRPAQSQKAMDLDHQAWLLVTGPEGQRNPARALELVQQAIALDPGNGSILNTLGVAQYRNGQYAAAVVTLEKGAAAKGEADAIDLFFLAMCHARLGDAARAKDCFARAVKWTEARKDLPSDWVADLKAFRAEAEGLLKGLK
jgi:WD40 repeat protein